MEPQKFFDGIALMNMSSLATSAAERLDLPDALLRAGIAAMVGRAARDLAAAPILDAGFADAMTAWPVAAHTQSANAQHYEVPAEFFGACLGPARKYSSCFYAAPGDSLAQAEQAALVRTVMNAGLADGQRILELGCGWGSLSLYMARRFPTADIVAVSNSFSQREYIEGVAKAEGLANLRILTADMNEFAPGTVFDRVVSVEMFEHIANWRALLTRIRSWLKPDGQLFLHVFSHTRSAYRFDHEGGSNWIAQHFFTGGIMPSHALIRQFSDLFTVEVEQRWSGVHYQRTALAWLANFDANQAAVGPVLTAVYGEDAEVWRRRWRLFFLAVAGLFGHAGGEVWGVSQYRLAPVG
jgi:cyclopropane-fatty-acyl-phospholipid synthase